MTSHYLFEIFIVACALVEKIVIICIPWVNVFYYSILFIFGGIVIFVIYFGRIDLNYSCRLHENIFKNISVRFNIFLNRISYVVVVDLAQCEMWLFVGEVSISFFLKRLE